MSKDDTSVFIHVSFGILCFLVAGLGFIVVEVIGMVSDLRERVDGIEQSQVEAPAETEEAATED